MTNEARDLLDFSLKFGGGIHSSASADEINPREAETGQNFALDSRNRNLRNRKPIDKLGTVPNEQEIRGFVSLKQRDGTITFLVQAGGTVYKWDAINGFASVGSCDSSAKLRGRLEHYFQLDDLVLVTDVNKSQPVMQWDGTTLSNISHNLGGNFFAKYCFVANERAYYGNVTAGTATPQVMAVSKRGDYDNLSTADRPSTALGADDPFFLTSLDLRPINGLVQAFGVVILSTEGGDISRLSGSNSQNFLLEGFAPRTGADGDESVVFTGNDIYYGRLGRIESVSATDSFGDVEQNDLSLEIKDTIETYNGWTSVYNARTQEVFFYPESTSELWLFKKSMFGGDVSPWSKFTTENDFAFSITAIMNALDPDDGLEYIFMGDASGNLYRLEGTGSSGDAGTSNIKTVWRSKLFSAPEEYASQGYQGYIKHRIKTAEIITLRLLQGGSVITNTTISPTLIATGDVEYFNDAAYFGGDFYFGAQFEDRFARVPITSSGYAEDLQVEIEYEGTNDIEINEVFLRFEAAN